MNMRFLFGAVACSLLLLNSGLAQPVNQSPLSIAAIMQKTSEWRGAEPENVYWGHDSQTVFFDWNPEKDTLSSLYRITLKELVPLKATGKYKATLPGRRMVYSNEHNLMADVRNGNLFLTDMKKNREQQLTSIAGQVSAPAFTPDERAITFMYNQNLYLVDIRSGLIHQLTNFVSGDEKPDRKTQGQELWLEQQQEELFDVLRERKLLRKAEENRKAPEDSTAPSKIYLGKDRLGNVSLSPSGNYVAYTVIRTGTGRETHVPHFVTASGFTEDYTSRTKVGSTPGAGRLNLYNRKTRTYIEVRTDSLPGIKDLPDFRNDYPSAKPSADKVMVREVSLSSPVWNRSNDLGLVIARALDNKDRWICLLDPETGRLRVLDRQRDEAWIAGPGISGFTAAAGWLSDDETVWFQSEENGYSHLVTVHTKTGRKEWLTQGNWEVYEPHLSRDGRYFWFTANIKHPGIRHFYRLTVKSGEIEQVTGMDGGNEIYLSPDEKWIAIRHSKGNEPWELYLQENKPAASARRITHSTTPEFRSYKWRMPEYVTFRAEDGETVYARLYKPETPHPAKPAVIFVHGAGYLQNAHQWWSSYYREYMFHNLLADNGYTVLDIDYRGSAGYGRNWRTGIYRHMGGKDLTDHVDGARFLVSDHGVAADRIGIYGGSYGGFITLMAMFRYPGVFAAGAALRSVTDWAHYNHGYTSNILNTPAEDSLAYVRSSPIYYAAGLKGALLMCHGMVDDNVHFQDIVRLTQRLIELGKENWELAVYPVESHAFVEPSSWTDEYRRIFKLFEENLK